MSAQSTSSSLSPLRPRLAPRPSALKMIIVAVLSLLLLGLSAMPADGQEPGTAIDERHAIATDGAVDLQVVGHDVLVTPSWSFS